MNAYESYITTELPWLFKMPYHWDIMRAKYMFQKESRAVFETDEVITCFRDGVVTLRKNRRTTGFTEAIQESGYQGIRKGDLVIHVMDAFAGAVGVSDSNGKGTPVYSVCTAKGDYNNYYYAHIVREMARSGYIQSLYRGIRQRSSDFRFEIFAAQYLPVPPREEQDQIVRYLDWQVSKINKLISARKKQIALLDELRRSITCHCVINGVDGNIKRKETEINWIDHIPEHWNVLFLSQVATEQAIKNTGLIEKNLLSLSYGRIVNKDINTAEGLLPASFEGYQIIHPGNIILRLTDLQNDHKSLRVGLSTQTGIITSAYTCLKVRDNILPEYLYLQLHSADICKVFYGMGGGVRQSIGYKDIRKMPVVVPPIEEQKLIVQKIHTLIAPFDTHIGKLNEKILHLSEYRTRLISDVVTGQIDVRDIEVPEFEYIADDVDDVSDDENTDLEEIMEEEE